MNKISSDPAQAQLLPGGGGGAEKRRVGGGWEKEACRLPRLHLKEPMPLHALFID